MPTYDYKCAACGAIFEEFQAILDKPLKKCKKCSKSKLVRLIGSGAGILFKGSGFYQTDYRSSQYHEAAKKDSHSPKGNSSCSGACKKDSKKKDSKS